MRPVSRHGREAQQSSALGGHCALLCTFHTPFAHNVRLALDPSLMWKNRNKLEMSSCDEEDKKRRQTNRFARVRKAELSPLGAKVKGTLCTLMHFIFCCVAVV